MKEHQVQSSITLIRKRSFKSIQKMTGTTDALIGGFGVKLL